MDNVTWSSVIASALTVDVLGIPEQPRVLVTGDVDALTAPDLVEVLTEVLRSRPDSVCVDLRSTTFFGAAGLSALLTARETARSQHTGWRVLVADHSIVWRVVDVTGLRERLDAVLESPF